MLIPIIHYNDIHYLHHDWNRWLMTCLIIWSTTTPYLLKTFLLCVTLSITYVEAKLLFNRLQRHLVLNNSGTKDSHSRKIVTIPERNLGKNNINRIWMKYIHFRSKHLVAYHYKFLSTPILFFHCMLAVWYVVKSPLRRLENICSLTVLVILS